MKSSLLGVALLGLFLAGCPQNSLYDFDGDGIPDTEDCAPEDPDIYPTAPDTEGDGIDQNCDGVDGVRNCDQDGDDYLDIGCAGGDDCNDNNPAIHPGAVELCDGEDGDCDGSLPAEEQDGDGDGDPGCSDCDDANPTVSGGDEDQDGYDECMGDCAEGNASIYPGAYDEWGDGIDQNCDGVDGDDQDGDGSPGNATPPGLGTPEWDCDDFDPALNRTDADGDGVDTCAEPPDCDDLDASRYPGNTEVACDGHDGDCVHDPDEEDGDADGVMPCEGDCDDQDPGSNIDADGDGWIPCDNDCNDTDPSVNPGYIGWEDPSDGIDSDCSGGDAAGLANADFLFTGEASGDSAGLSVAGGGDVDADGLDDVLVGARSNSESGPGAGKTYLLLGSTILSAGGVDLATADATFLGEASSDRSGSDVAFVGDIDGDGLDEIAVVAPENDEGGNDAGKTYVYFGATIAAGGSFSLANADAVFIGEAPGDGSWTSGQAVAFGDFDGDGLADLVIGAQHSNSPAVDAGKTSLFFGTTVAAGGTFILGSGDATFVGEAAGDYSGSAVASAGDVDADGLSDLLIGARGNDEAADYSGKSYLFLGTTISAGGEFDLASADITFTGEAEDDQSGSSLAALGDIDGDGLGDIAVGAYQHDSSRGKVYLFFGSTLADGSSFPLSAADASMDGEATGDSAGIGLSVGDVDGNGQGDILIGARQNSDGGAGAGKTYLLVGDTLMSGGPSLGASDAAFVGEASGDHSGYSVSLVGDVDGDGRDDVLVGAFGNESGGGGAGRVYLLLSPY